MSELIRIMVERFVKQFGPSPLVVVSPGRVNLIGEHTDYNEGFVLPAATDKAVVFAMGARNDNLCHFVSHDFNQEFRCGLDELHLSPLRWPNYLLGVLEQLVRHGCRFNGINCVFGGDIPIGAGMSSSAAIEGGLVFGLNEIYGLGLDKLTMVKLAQKAENEFVGVKCGIMDQFINIHGRARSVLKLDCRSLGFEYFPFEREDLRIVVSDTMVRRELAGSEYNVRRSQCEEAVNTLRRHHPEMKSLRDVTSEMLSAHKSELDPVAFKRADYVIRENIRVGLACQALLGNDYRRLGELMNVSHEGLKNDYQVSSAELDLMVEEARKVPGVLGSRMMGAGFGGCAISLVEADAVFEFRKAVGAGYQAATGREPKIYVIRIEAGTRTVPVE